MSTSNGGWPRGRIQWLVGAIVIIVLSAIVGAVLGNLWTGLLLGGAVSVGWLIAYESWRGRHVGLDDEDDDGAQL